MANTFDSTLFNAALTEVVVPTIAPKLAYLTKWSTDFSDELVSKRARTISVPVFYDNGKAVNTDPSDYTTNSGSTLSACKVDLVELSVPVEMGPINSQKGLPRIESLLPSALNLLAKKIEAVVFANFTSTNFSVATGLSAVTSGSMALADLNKLNVQIDGLTKNVILKTSESGFLLPSSLTSYDIKANPASFGWDYISTTDGGFAAAGSKVIAFAGAESALAMASGIPQYDQRVIDMLDRSIIELGQGLPPIAVSQWVEMNTRKAYLSLDLMFGCSPARKDHAKLVTIA
jgi:hypothetical protein